MNNELRDDNHNVEEWVQFCGLKLQDVLASMTLEHYAGSGIFVRPIDGKLLADTIVRLDTQVGLSLKPNDGRKLLMMCHEAYMERAKACHFDLDGNPIDHYDPHSVYKEWALALIARFNAGMISLRGDELEPPKEYDF